MTFKYYAVMQGEVVDKSNSLTSLRNRMDDYVHSMPSNMDYVYIVKGKKNPFEKEVSSSNSTSSFNNTNTSENSSSENFYEDDGTK